MIVKLLTEHHLELLSFTGGCRGSSESTLVKMSNFWKSHALAQMILNECASMEGSSGVEDAIKMGNASNGVCIPLHKINKNLTSSFIGITIGRLPFSLSLCWGSLLRGVWGESLQNARTKSKQVKAQIQCLE